jgi:deoxyribonuclease-4
VRGIRRVTRTLRRLLDVASDVSVAIALETTSGQGTQLGGRLEEVQEAVDRLDGHPRLGICVDTCHVFAAGYDIRTERGYREFTGELLHRFGVSRILAWHLNDSRGDCGSRVDRHAHIGEGRIGLPGFRRLMNDRRFEHLPMVLETPKTPGPDADRRHLRLLRGLRTADS